MLLHGWCRKIEVGSRLKRKGMYVSMWLIYFIVQQKLAWHCKAIIGKRKIKKCRQQESGRKNHPTTLSNLKNIFSVYINMCKHAMSLQLCPTLCNPMDCSPPASSVHGTLQARILAWVVMPSSRGSSWSRGGTRGFYVSCIGRRVLYRESHLGSPCLYIYISVSVICILNFEIMYFSFGTLILLTLSHNMSPFLSYSLKHLELLHDIS